MLKETGTKSALCMGLGCKMSVCDLQADNQQSNYLKMNTENSGSTSRPAFNAQALGGNKLVWALVRLDAWPKRVQEWSIESNSAETVSGCC